MDLYEVITKYKGKLSDTDSLIMEYELFFDNASEKYCGFALDEYEELEQLNNIILKIKDCDKEAEIYVCTYAPDFVDNGIYIYADTIWVDTMLSIEKIYGLFENYPKIEPRDIVLLSEDETIDGIISLVIRADGKVEEYGNYVKNVPLNRIKSLYWD